MKLTLSYAYADGGPGGVYHFSGDGDATNEADDPTTVTIEAQQDGSLLVDRIVLPSALAVRMAATIADEWLTSHPLRGYDVEWLPTEILGALSCGEFTKARVLAAGVVGTQEPGPADELDAEADDGQLALFVNDEAGHLVVNDEALA